MPHRLPVHMFTVFQTEIHVKPRASPQAELLPGRLRMTGSFCPRSASLGLSEPLWASLGLSQPASQPPSQPAKHLTGFLVVIPSASQPASQPAPW